MPYSGTRGRTPNEAALSTFRAQSILPPPEPECPRNGFMRSPCGRRHAQKVPMATAFRFRRRVDYFDQSDWLGRVT